MKFLKKWWPLLALLVFAGLFLFLSFRNEERARIEEERFKKMGPGAEHALEMIAEYTEVVRAFEALPEAERDPMQKLPMGDGAVKVPVLHALMRRASLRAQIGELDAAYRDYCRARSLTPEFHRHCSVDELAYNFSRRDEYMRTIELFEAAMKASPDTTDWSYGQFLSETKHDAIRDPKRGLTLMTQYMQRKKDIQPWDHRLYAQALLQEERFADALEHLELSLQGEEERNGSFIQRYQQEIDRFLQMQKEGKDTAAAIRYRQREIQAMIESHVRTAMRIYTLRVQAAYCQPYEWRSKQY